MFVSMRFDSGCLFLIDQRRLPHEQEWVSCGSLEAVAQAIEAMVVRGAPAIATAAAYGLAIDAAAMIPAGSAAKSYQMRFEAQLERLAATRPTAVNLFHVLERFRQLGATLFMERDLSGAAFAERLALEAAAVFNEDLNTCHAIGSSGLEHAKNQNRNGMRVLTHCNTGSLATSGYGTALGVIRSLFKAGRLAHVYVDETRPYLQGSRLTAFELAAEGIPHTLIADSMAAFVMQQGLVDWVVVGADRIVANGDTANKIGTYSLAVVAKYHDVEFYVAAPKSTFDMNRADGRAIPIELRAETELTQFHGVPIAPKATSAYNPSFDVTPHQLITGFFTEHGFMRTPTDEA